MQKNSASFLAVGVVIGIIIGAVLTLVLKKERYQFFSPNFKDSVIAGRMDVSTGQIWFLVQPEGTNAQWVKITTSDQK